MVDDAAAGRNAAAAPFFWCKCTEPHRPLPALHASDGIRWDQRTRSTNTAGLNGCQRPVARCVSSASSAA